MKMLTLPRRSISTSLLTITADLAQSIKARLVMQAAATWTAAHIVLVSITYIAVALTPARQTASPAAPIAPQTFLAAWNKWDAQWFVAIAQGGYTTPQQTAFFPLYPLLTSALSHLLGGHALLAGMLASNVASLAAFALLALLAYDLLPSAASAQRAVRLLASTPVAFFLAAAYGDALFLGLALAALLCARRRWWLAAAGLAFLASFTRVSALALLAAFAVEAWPHISAASWRARSEIAAALASVPAGLALWSLFCLLRFGDPLEWLHVQSTQWLHQPMWPWMSAGYVIAQQRAVPLLSFLQARSLLDVAPWLLLAAICIWSARSHALPPSWLAYCAVLLWLCIAAPVVVTNGPFPGIPSAARYLLAAAPAYIPLARLSARYPSLEWLLFAGGMAVQSAALAFFLIAPQAAYGLV